MLIDNFEPLHRNRSKVSKEKKTDKLFFFIAKLTHLGSWHVEAFFEYGWLRFRGDIRIESSFFLPRGFNEQLSNEHGEYPRKIETTVYVKIQMGSNKKEGGQNHVTWSL